MKITDSVLLSDKMVVNDSGYLECAALTARVGIQQYTGEEMGRPDIFVVNVYRDESEVFSKKSLDTFSKLPITNDHPAEEVTAENWKELAVGSTGDDVLRDGEYLKIGLKITDASAVKSVQDGKRELSVGYSAEIEWVDGVAPDGTPYQAVQKNIVANHIAIVDQGRAGPRARIGDSWGNEPKPTGGKPTKTNDAGGHMTKTVILGDAAVTVPVADAVAIEAFKAASAKAIADAKQTNDAAIAAKDADMAKLQAQLDDAKEKILSDADIDARVAARADLVAKAKSISPDVKTDGVKDSDIRKAVVAAKLGDAAIAEKSEAYVDARFDILVEDMAEKDPVATAFAGAGTTTVTDSRSGYLARLARTKQEA